MSDLSFRHFLDTLKTNVSIEDVVAARVPGLKRAGAEWKGCCPFHEERTPSFHVVPDKGFFHCFGCGASGDVIGFLQRFDGVEFMEAVEELAHSVGLEVPKKRGPRGDDGREARLLEALERAERLFVRTYRGPQGAAARAYMAERGLGDGVAEAFGIGWAPATGHALVDAASEAGFDRSALVDAGLVKKGDDGRFFDFFRGRLIVPIRDARGRTIGFGGRVLPGAKGPKYLNTAETALFHKGRTVFGLDLASTHARRARHVVVMEGYTDVLAAHQAGLRQSVAVLGTATTADHARVLRRTGAQRVSLVFDGDRAGRAAALKALAGVLARGEFETVDVIALPEDSDPCDLLVARGANAGELADDAIGAALAEPVEWFAFLVDGFAGLGPKELTDAVDDALGVVAVLPNPVEREARVRELAAAAGLSESAVSARFEELARSARRPAARTPAASGASGRAAGDRGAHATRMAVGGEPRSGGSERHAAEQGPREDPRRRQFELRAWADLVAACLVDNALVGLFRDRLEAAREGRGPRHEGLARVLELLCDLYEEDEARLEDGSASDAGSLLSVDASRIASAAAAAELEEGSPEDLAHVFGGNGTEGGAGGVERGQGERGISADRGIAADQGISADQVASIAVRLQERARRADDVRALARGAVDTLARVEKERTTAEMLAAAERGEDPDAARLEAANRAYGLDRRVGADRRTPNHAPTHP